ncbi:MAG: AAA family ATPase [Sulfurovum sp.]
MITKLDIKGYKSIKKQSFDFRNITIFTGLNSTGKSSVIQSLLLFSSFSSNNLLMRNEMKKFTKFSDVRNRYENANEIIFKVYEEENTSTLNIKRDSKWKVDNPLDSFIFEENLFYISSNRIGAEEMAHYDEDIKFGLDGKYVFSYFEQYKHKMIDETLIKDKSSSTLERQLSYWFKHILDLDLTLKTEKITTNVVKVSFICDGLDNLSPFNVGAGNSYLAKILIMGLSCKKDNILIIENPEIHLHPKAQAKIAEFFAFLASKGIQIILETHNDHIINRLCYEEYKQVLKKDEIVIYYKNSILEPFEKIEIQNGQFLDQNANNQFPEGFFDATLAEIFEING